MSNYLMCCYCKDYFDEDNGVICDCGKKWCSVRCARLDNYLNRKKKSSCNFCRKEENTPNLFVIKNK